MLTMQQLTIEDGMTTTSMMMNKNSTINIFYGNDILDGLPSVSMGTTLK